jgi:hypothetical protein
MLISAFSSSSDCGCARLASAAAPEVRLAGIARLLRRALLMSGIVGQFGSGRRLIIVGLAARTGRL